MLSCPTAFKYIDRGLGVAIRASPMIQIIVIPPSRIQNYAQCRQCSLFPVGPHKNYEGTAEVARLIFVNFRV